MQHYQLSYPRLLIGYVGGLGWLGIKSICYRNTVPMQRDGHNPICTTALTAQSVAPILCSIWDSLIIIRIELKEALLVPVTWIFKIYQFSNVT